MNTNALYRTLSYQLPKNLKDGFFVLLSTSFTGFIISFIAIFGFKADNYPSLGALFYSIFIVTYMILIFALTLNSSFYGNVKMNISRINSFLAPIISYLIRSAVFSALLPVIFFIEKSVCTTLFSPYAAYVPIGVDFFTSPFSLFKIFIIALLIGVVMCAIVSKFGKAGFWALYILYFAALAASNTLARTSFLAIVSFIQAPAFTVSAWLVGIVLVVISSITILKSDIPN